jgi:LSD1 subclass zinc finger protein
MTACEHNWQWLPRPVFTLGMLGQRRGAHNVECTKCHARTWAHGHGPNTPAETIIEPPTTEGS